MNVVAVLPVSKVVMFEAPLVVPASMTYEVTGIKGEDGAAVHVSVTVLTLTLAASAEGGPLGAASATDSAERRRDAHDASVGADPKIPIDCGARDVKQLHVVVTGDALAWAPGGAAVVAVDGLIGAGRPPHAAAITAQTRSADEDV